MTLLLDAAPAWTRGGAAPTYATPRDPSAPTDGPRIAKIAEALGRPGMPWQRYVWDVATEHEPDGSLRYEIVLVTVPRQSGKTTAYGPVQIDRAIMNPGIKTFYTAQTGKDARSRFNDLVELIGTSALARIATFRFSAGDEAIRYPNGSQNKLFAPVVAALHGETPPLVGMDEIWELDEELGDAILEGAIIPAQMTLAGCRQIWLFSTAGTAASKFMKWVDRGRLGTYPKLAYFEWSLPEGADPFDPEVLASFHPAVGFTVTVDELLDQARAVSLATWMRAYCNAWTEAADPLVPEAEWRELAKPQAVPRRRDVTLTYEVAPDYASGDVMASWWDDAGKLNVRLVHHAPGTGWMHDLIVQLVRVWNPTIVGADDGKPNRRLTDELRRTLGDERITTVAGRDFPTACDAFLGYVLEERSLIHDGSRTLARAIAGAVLNRTGEGVTISRVRSATPPGSLIAGAIGLWLAQHPPEDSGGNEIPDLAELLGR